MRGKYSFYLTELSTCLVTKYTPEKMSNVAPVILIYIKPKGFI